NEMSATAAKKTNRRKLVAIGMAAGLLAAAAGCAPEGSGRNLPPPPGTQYFPLSPNGGPSNPNIASMPDQVRAAIMGNYGGKLFRRDWGGTKTLQDYNLTIQQVSGGTQAGAVYAYMILDSDGPIGPIHLEGYMAMGLNNYFGVYSLASQA